MTTEETLSDGTALFLPDEERDDAHIVDVLIEERCPSFVSHWTWPIIRPVLYRMLGYKRAVEMADLVEQLPGADSFDHLATRLAFKLTTHHLERIPSSGRLIIAANHPTGLADGVAVWEAVKQVRSDLLFFANADAIRVSEGFADTIIPVEWVMDKRSAAKTKETLRRAKDAFEREQCVIIFPSGKLANMENGKLTEKDWFSTVVSLARKQKCPILPMNLNARNSTLYYALSRLNGELRDITLFYELLNKTGSAFEITCGPLILPETLTGDVQKVTEQLRNYVSYELGSAPDKPFVPADL
ncbi:MAG: acyltransferase [Ponticaulis sp.]|nr:acyltransferase [Ponticaulis sp.]